MKDFNRCAFLACLLASASQSVKAARTLQEDPAQQDVQSETGVRSIYSDGVLKPGWESWPWGIDYLNFEDSTYTLPNTGASMCTKIKRFGAVSLKTTEPFQAKGKLTFWQKQNSEQDAGFEIQLESSVSVQYAVSSAASLGNQDETSSAIQVVSEIPGSAPEVGGDSSWVKKEIALEEFADSAMVFDRITLGRCLQQGDDCKRDQQSPHDDVVLICLSEIQLEGQPDQYNAFGEEGQAAAFGVQP